MKEILDIRIIDLVIGFVIMLLPISFFLYFKIKLVKNILVALSRMILQLGLIALYLEWIFDKNSAVINSIWVFMMIIVGVFTSINRIGLKWKTFVVPMILASFTSILIIDAFFLGVVIRLDYVFDARYFIPITGMVLGNSLNHNIVGLTTYYKGLSEKNDLYYFLLTNAGDSTIAKRPFMTEAVKRGLNPLIATMTVIGLITLPGVMTGQILGGSPPLIAIKYQVMIMLAIFTGCTLNLFLTILFSNRYVFDNFQRFRDDIFK